MSVLALPSQAEIEALAATADTSDLKAKSLDDLAEEARYHKDQAEQHHRISIWHYVECGRRLLEAKRRMKQAELTVWATQEIGVRKSEAYNLMQLARPDSVQRVGQMAPEVSVRAALEAIAEQRYQERQATVQPKPIPQVILPEQLVIDVCDAADLNLPDGIVDLTVTSPPYGLGVEYAQADDDQGYPTYLEHASTWAAEMFRVAAPQGRLCLNVPLDVTRGGRKPVYADWTHCLKEAGWQYETTILWNEDNISKSTARGSVDSPSAAHVITRVEAIVVVCKGEWNLHRNGPHDLAHEGWLDWTNGLWSFPGARPLSDEHCPKPFPEELPRRCIELFSFRGDVVLDPFLGSGTTGVVAAQLGRRFYGFDHSAKYVDQARVRIAEALRSSGG